ncbi:MAG: glycoside hydrolase family 3 protein, partial [Bacteroidota bacterium]
MKRFLKIIGYTLLAIIVLLFLALGFLYVKSSLRSTDNLSLLGNTAPRLTENNITFRDLNKNGTLDPYENPNTPIEDRVQDLLQQMTLEEKAGAMFITMAGMDTDGEPIEKPVFSTDMLVTAFSFLLPGNSEMVVRKHMNSFNILGSMDNRALAHYNNRIQQMAERTRLGIPVTIGTDPRHGVPNNPGASIYTPQFSAWPGPLGLAATRDTALVRTFADIARQEYLATGIRLALHPMADLATEPRWGRILGTFGEDAELATRMSRAYVLGFQGDTLGRQSVACMSKHFSGGGPQEDGEDPHFPYGKNQVYPGNMFQYHMIPFRDGVLRARTAQMMPYYGIPVGQTSEDVAFAFNKLMITGWLRDSLKFNGVICTDWNIISDTPAGEGRAWGVEHLSVPERVKKVIDAGCDQFGGESIPEVLVELVKSGKLTEARLDESVARILRDKFRLGLFEDPYVDEDAAARIAENQEFREKGMDAQARSTVLLKNDGLLPLKAGAKIYAEGFSSTGLITKYGQLEDTPEEADVIF